MTTEELAKMSLEEKRIAMATACGWKFWHDEQETILCRPDENWPALPHWKSRGMMRGDGRPKSPLVDISLLPDYPGLDAMAAAVASLDEAQRHAYVVILSGMLWLPANSRGWEDWRDTLSVSEATAAQRCDAFLLSQP